jgi:hypothetical protein
LQSTDDEVQPFFDRALSAEKAKQHVSKKAFVRAVEDIGKVSQWTDADTAILREVETFEFPREFVALGFVFH